MKILLIICFAVGLGLLSAVAKGQTTTEQEDEASSEIPVQLTIISPLGTNGLESGKITNKVSINLFAGYAGGLKGVEFGGFANLLRGELYGAQFAGFSNTVIGEGKGAQFSGFSNIVRKHMYGAQFAGFSNVVADSMQGAQFAGFSNIVRGSSQVLQAAGFGNLATGDMEGAQIAGFGNTHTGNLKGTQIAGFGNTNTGNVKGAQIAGFANIARDVDGGQVAGFINVARKVRGTQIGFINVADTVEGIALGFFSVVRKGYKAFEVQGHESLYGNLSVKSGTERFYNIITIGARPGPNGILWGYGYGVGTFFHLNQQYKMNIDATASHLNEGDWFTSELNLLNKLQANIAWDLSDNVQLYGGASFNVHVSNVEDSEGTLIGSDAVPWSVYDHSSRNTLIRMYPGFQFGMRL